MNKSSSNRCSTDIINVAWLASSAPAFCRYLELPTLLNGLGGGSGDDRGRSNSRRCAEMLNWLRTTDAVNPSSFAPILRKMLALSLLLNVVGGGIGNDVNLNSLDSDRALQNFDDVQTVFLPAAKSSRS